MSAFAIDPLAGVLLIPIATAGLLALISDYRLSARLNVAASLATLLAALLLFVERPALFRRYEHEGAATTVVRGVDGRLRERSGDATAPPGGLDPHGPDPAHAAVDAQDAGAHDLAIGLRDERTHLGMGGDEPEVDPSVAPVVP